MFNCHERTAALSPPLLPQGYSEFCLGLLEAPLRFICRLHHLTGLLSAAALAAPVEVFLTLLPAPCIHAMSSCYCLLRCISSRCAEPAAGKIKP